MFRLVVQLGQLEVRMETDGTYPDCVNDITNRAKDMLESTIRQISSAGWSPLDVEIEEETQEELDPKPDQE